MTSEVYLNGAYLPISEAKVSVLDRGFLFGDGVYEVIPCYSGRLFRLEQHLDRLQSSLQLIRMPNPHSQEQWREILQILIQQFPAQDQSVYLQVTRGAHPQRDHLIPPTVTPTVFAMTNLMPAADPAIAKKGISVITQPDSRWHHCNIKAITLLANVLMKSEARDKEAQEAILIRDGLATEGTASNLFIVVDETVITPPKSAQLLPGITRDLILELARDNGVACKEQPITQAQLESADEIWMTSSTREIMPVTALNGHPVGIGKPGPMFHTMSKLFADFKQQLRKPDLEI